MSAPRLTTKKKILTVLFAVLFSVLALEVAARLIYRGPIWVNPYYVRMSRDYPELDKFLAERYTNPLLRYYDEFLYAASLQTTDTVNFTGYYSARLVPASVALSEAEEIVWAFGGSTMENTETTDDLSIANAWAKIFNRTLGPTHVKNLGTGGFFSSYELIKFQKMLREVPENERPTIAIFYDGYNDALFGFQYGPGSPQKDLSLKLRALVEQEDLALSTYTASRWLSRYSKLWERTGARAAEYFLFPLPEPAANRAALEASVRIYSTNVRIIRATCTAFDVRCIFVLQPLLVTKQPLHALEQEVLDSLTDHPKFGPEGVEFVRTFYREAARQLSGNEDFINASMVMDGRDEPDFYDLGHTGIRSAHVIGEATARLILECLDATRTSVHRPTRADGR